MEISCFRKFGHTNTCNIDAQVFQNDSLKISRFDDDLWVVETTDMTTMYIIEGEERALLIDTGTECDSLDKIIEHVTNKPFDVVLTHTHPDHAGNVQYFDTIWYHAADTII